MSKPEFAAVLPKVKLTAERQDEYTVHQVFEGSKHLPKCYATGRKNAYYVHNYETNEIMVYGDLNTIKEFREWCANYDRKFEIAAWEKQEAEEAEEAALQANREVLNALQDEYTSDYDGENPTFVVGERIISTFASSKVGKIGEILFDLTLPEVRERHWDYQERKYYDSKNWHYAECEVEKIVNITDELYDRLVANLIDSQTCIECEIGRGGTGSDYQVADDWDFTKASKEEQNLWRAQAYNAVTVVQAPNRKSIVIDASGYDYGRYVGVNPTKMDEWQNQNR